MQKSSEPIRLEPHATQLINRSMPVVFDFNGSSIRAFDGDTIASALYANGVRIFSRSFKYHRPRGLLCVAGNCPNCLMTVDGEPNVRVCTRSVRSGMHVQHQNAWPSLEWDVMSVLDRIDWMLPVGFYYKTFHKPKIMWRIAEPLIRRIAGLGAINFDSSQDTRYVHTYMHTDVLIVGGGLAGMSAALAVAERGRDVILVDDQSVLGGYLRFDTSTYNDVVDVGTSTGHEIARLFASQIATSSRIRVFSNSTAFGFYEGNLIGIIAGTQMIKLRASQVVIATGSYETPTIFEKNDMAGVMLSSAVQRLIHLYGIKPGSTALVTTSSDQGYKVTLDLIKAGIKIAAIADSRRGFPLELDAAKELQAKGVLTLSAHAPVRAEGAKRIQGGVVARINEDRLTTEERQFDCDLICATGELQPANSLLLQAGAKLTYNDSLGEMVPDNLPDGVFATGGVAGIHDLGGNLIHGRSIGEKVALGVRKHKDSGAVKITNKQTFVHDEKKEIDQAFWPTPMGHENGARRFVCFCEDVTVKDIQQGIDEGFQDIQTLKRYSTVTMGPCQGKMCSKAFSRITAEKMDCAVDEVGMTTSRPPVQPVPLGAISGASHIPIKRTALYQKHVELGAEIIDMPPWKRAYSYGSPQDESLAVRQRVGIIDVSTLGKLDLKGRDVPALLDKIYTNRFSDLRVGHIRYGIMCSDNGVIMDDGTVARLAEQHYYLTTSTGNIEPVEEWIKWWMAGSKMCAHITNVTSAYGVINVAGPRARETLTKLTEVDLSPAANRYMRLALGLVAGVPTSLLRIGFVGEIGWELHFPAEYSEHVWDALMEAGDEYGVAPFGVEAQRILRLEKSHVIVTQDTDAVTNPLDIGSDWAVKFDKPDFIGRKSLEIAKNRGLKNRLVGFVMRDRIVPDDGDPVVVGDVPIGRVTSSRLSPTMGTGFGLAWLPVDMAEEGREIYIRIDKRNFAARITLKPIYDPDGQRLRG